MNPFLGKCKTLLGDPGHRDGRVGVDQVSSSARDSYRDGVGNSTLEQRVTDAVLPDHAMLLHHPPNGKWH